MKKCPKCNFLHSKSGLYCSRGCANSRGPRTEAFKLRVSEKLKGRVPSNKGKSKPKIIRKCLLCDNTFTCDTNSKRKYCTGKCNPKSGGYREGSGRSKSGYYKGIYCGSTYELIWVIYQLDHNINFDRFPNILEYDGKKYFPDFIQNSKIIEIKGYEDQQTVEIKTHVANMNGYEVIILRKDDLLKEFKWVKLNYNYKNVQDLYDNYKPKYNYKCDYCDIEFNTDKKKRTNIKYCSRKCSSLGNKRFHVRAV